MRDRSSRSEEAEKPRDAEVVVEPAPEMVEAVAMTDVPAEEPAPQAEAAPEPPSRDDDVGATLDHITAELNRLRLAYGEDVARHVGERAITGMRKAGGA